MVGSEKYHNGKIEEQFHFVLNARLVMLFFYAGIFVRKCLLKLDLKLVRNDTKSLISKMLKLV